MINIFLPFLLVFFIAYDIYIKNIIVDTNISLQKSIEENTKIYLELHTILDANNSTVFIMED